MTMPRGAKAALILGLAALAACKGTSSTPRPQPQTNDSPNPTCSSETVEVAVGDGYLQHLCGCAKTVGEPLQNFGCQLNVGATVVFIFVGQGKHQLIPTTGSSFAASPVTTLTSPARTYALQFNVSGVYGFTDAYFPQLTGSIIVP